MTYVTYYQSPLGLLTLAASETALTGCWFENQAFYAAGLGEYLKTETPLLAKAAAWLELYFSGVEPDFSIPLSPLGTDFQQQVWSDLLAIPYGKTATYGHLAKKLAIRQGIPKMSAQAVGNAVGRNPIAIFIPCHRVLGTGGKLTGYAGGLERKKKLLILENAFG